MGRKFFVGGNWKCRPIVPVDLYRSIRDSQLVGLSGYTKEMLTSISTVHDLNYPEKTETYYVVNVLDRQSIRLLMLTIASPLIILSTKNSMVISRSKHHTENSSRWDHCMSVFLNQIQMMQRLLRSFRLSFKRSASRMHQGQPGHLNRLLVTSDEN